MAYVHLGHTRNRPAKRGSLQAAPFFCEASHKEGIHSEREPSTDVQLDPLGRKDHAAFQERLGYEDKQKLDKHLQSIRDLESRLAVTATFGEACNIAEIALPLVSELLVRVGAPTDQ